MVCLDSDFLIAFLRGNPEAERKILQLKQSGERLTITPISATELYFGAIKADRTDGIEKTKLFLSMLELLEFDLAAAEKTGEVIATLEKKGQRIGDKDELTAGIALRHCENTIITRNKKHFEKIPGIKVEKW